MTKFSIDQIMDYTEKWLVTGELNQTIIADGFHFHSPFWTNMDKKAFIGKFLDPTEYIDKSLSNIVRFEFLIKLKNESNTYFSIILQYHTKYGVSVDEAVLGTVQDGLLVELRSIYDLEKTKQAHRL